MYKIYDKNSSLNWAYYGFKTVEEMKSDVRFNYLFQDNDYLLVIDNEEKVYDVVDLENLFNKYNYDNQIYSNFTPEEALKITEYRIQIPKPSIGENNQAILELSNIDDKEESSKNVISLYANGNRTAYIPDATTIGAMWTNSIALGKKTIDDVPEQYKDEVTYRLENNIFD